MAVHPVGSGFAQVMRVTLTIASFYRIIPNMKNNCVFCAIATGEIPSFKVYEDDIVLAYMDINPFTKGHVLVIPKEHTEGLLDTPDTTLAAVIARVKKIAAHSWPLLAISRVSLG